MQSKDKNIYSVIDIGTNTCLLLTAKLQDKTLTEIYESQEIPRLGKDLYRTGMIPPESFQNVLKIFNKYKTVSKEHGSEKIFAFGTSAMRDAANSNEFIDFIENGTGIRIRIINGEEEAKYSFEGAVFDLDTRKEYAVLDIGGGSNECIICHQNEILWKHSFECGMQRIVSKFGLSHPLPQTTLDNVTEYLNEKFALLTEIVPQYSIDLLIGSAGAFDVFRSIYFAQQNIPNPQSVAQEIPMNDFKAIVEYLCTHSIDEIESMKGMCIPRAPLLPIAGCIADFVVSKYTIPQLFQSSYSLKEGVIHTMMQ